MNKLYLSALIIIASVFSTGKINAQLIDCNVYLKGNYMEIGINNNGAFGTSYDPPSGYHPYTPLDTMYNDCTTFSFNSIHGLGFVVDAHQDGWSTGSPVYYGDYIMPGKPKEGWAFADNTASASAYSYSYEFSSAGYTGPLTGANTTYTSTGALLQGEWDGTFTGTTTILIKQKTTIDTANLFLHVHIDFYNTATTTDTFYYLRFIDPQNEATMTSSYTTTNVIEHQLPDPAGLVVVSATGLTDSIAYVALGTKDPRAKSFIMRDSTLPGFVPLSAIWAGDTAHYRYHDTLTGDLGMGLIYRMVAGPGDSTSLDYVYSFKGSVIDTLFDSTSIPILKIPAANKSTVRVFPNPTNELVNITGLSAGDNYTLSDIIGRPIMQSGAINSQSSQTISVATLPSGIYLLAVRDANGNVRSRVRLQKL